jgi:hypothetical protein
MLIIIDKKIPSAAKENLSQYGEVVELMTESITYPAISGHPDIFFCQGPGKLIVAPNLPRAFDEKLTRDSVPILTGEFPVGENYPKSSAYNAVVTDKFLIHNFRYTDFTITRAFENHRHIHVGQGYCRCNLLPLKNDHFITSDDGIFKVMKHHSENTLKVNSNGILLEGHKHGFFGGCCGVFEDKVFILGSLEHYEDGKKVEAFLKELHYKIIDLYDGPLFDGGGIFFVSVES